MSPTQIGIATFATFSNKINWIYGGLKGDRNTNRRIAETLSLIHLSSSALRSPMHFAQRLDCGKVKGIWGLLKNIQKYALYQNVNGKK